MSGSPDLVDFGGWKKNLRIANPYVELIVTLEVGPRIISYRTTKGANVFKTFPEQLGGSGEAKWMARGGHRFWLAPEDPVLSYLADNTAVEHRILSETEVELSNPPNEQFPIRKWLRIRLDSASSRVTLCHRAQNCGAQPVRAATWGLSVMRPGGVEIIPLPPLGEHPRNLLPNRTMTLWPYASMADPRWGWGERFITLRQAAAPPTKLGLLHRERWVAYHSGQTLFVKTIEFQEGATYPDFACNFETFTNEEMLEIEALGQLVDIEPDEATEHIEHWHLFDGIPAPPVSEDALAAWTGEWLKLVTL